MNTVRDSIDAYAKASGLTREDIATRLGICPSTLYGKMRGDYEFTMREAYLLSKSMGCTLDDFYAMTQES